MPYYWNPDILQALAYQCHDREVWLKAGKASSPRPRKVNSPDQLSSLITNFQHIDPISIFASIETFTDPLRLGAADQPTEKLRIGWDFVIDLDAEKVDKAKVTATAICEVLETFGLSAKAKFSGNRGFHVIIPGQAFDNFRSKEEFLAAYPQVPFSISRFIEASLRPEQKKGVVLDSEIYNPRRLLRLAYSLHDESRLVSVPVEIEELRSFNTSMAQPESVDAIDWTWLKLQSKTGEGSDLLTSVAEWVKSQRKKPAVTVVAHPPRAVNRIEWIEKLLFQPVDDGRHRILWLIIAPYLTNIRELDPEVAEPIVVDYLERCDSMNRIKGDVRSLARYYLRYAKQKGLRPLSYLVLKEKHPELWSIIESKIKV